MKTWAKTLSGNLKLGCKCLKGDIELGGSVVFVVLFSLCNLLPVLKESESQKKSFIQCHLNNKKQSHLDNQCLKKNGLRRVIRPPLTNQIVKKPFRIS